MNKEELAELICEVILSQNNEIDDLGDGESIVLCNNSPTINVVELAEKILEKVGQ